MLVVKIKKRLTHFILDVEFQLANDILVLFGPSGSGKTTILNSIAGLVDPDEGEISLDSTHFYRQGQKSFPTRKRNIGYLFQDYALFPHMTVERNILYGVKQNSQASAQQAALVRFNRKSKGLTPFIEQILEVLGITHLLQKYPHQISGGEKQRVALARALATEPALMLLDEPLSALDQETRWECQDELLRLHQLWKIPFIVVTHDRDEVERIGDEIIFLKQGQIVERSKRRRHQGAKFVQV